MISVSEALDHLFALAEPLGPETVPLLHAAGRVLAADAIAQRDQPPFAASAMDGYAVTDADPQPGASYSLVGESAAGHRFHGTLSPGETVRIFTGAPVPSGATRVIIQEDVRRHGDKVTITAPPGPATHIRDAGGDFRSGDRITAPRLLSSADIALLASMNLAEVTVTRKPVVALISTGDELVMPGETPGPDQIIASNTLGLHAQLRALGAAPRVLPIARDTRGSLAQALDMASDADLIVTIGGASVGDHDLVADVTDKQGMTRAFYKVAMRPGKPLMAGRLRSSMLLGLPGNPVSALVCGHVFVAPVVRAMLGLGRSPAPRQTAPLAADLAANGPREHYMRARLDGFSVTAFRRQDSSLLRVLTQANALLIRPPHDPARKAGESVAILPLQG